VESAGEREVAVRIFAPAHTEVRLELPSLVGWSLGELPRDTSGGSPLEAVAFDLPAHGWDVTLRVRGPEPLPLRVTVWWEGAVSPGLVRLREGLPASSTGSFALARTRVQGL
jgi:hypothetical protein